MSLKTVTQYSLSQIAEAIITSQDSISALQPLLPDEDHYADYLLDVYQFKTDTIIDGAIYYADGMSADEIAVFLLPDSSGVKDIEDTLVKYKERRTDEFTGYAPEQAAVLENSVVITHGDYVALLICEKPQNAESVFLACFSDDPPEIKDKAVLSSSEDENLTDADKSGTDNEKMTGESSDETDDIKKDIFDSAALLEAWRSGDKSKLSSKNRSVFDACIDIIDTVIDDDMSDYEKELAIHDWIVDWTDYDKEAINNSPEAKPDPDNDNPYGVIFQKKAICVGYTSTFQLFMDLLGIECISVKGVSQNTGGEHAWNMVRLNGEWYCVDVTWDDPSGGNQSASSKHQYFNVTSQFMQDTKHQWDESTTPVADAGKLYID
jgi:hypothetical protein